jgi:hypothetical protein
MKLMSFQVVILLACIVECFYICDHVVMKLLQLSVPSRLPRSLFIFALHDTREQ